LTQPDRPAGRGLRALASPVKTFAQQHGLELYQPPTLRAAETQERLRAAKADAMVVAAYGLILPPPALEVARHGAINVHASLLPRWRGAAPIQRALLGGDSETGVCIMQMNEGLDTGPVFAQRRVPIGVDDDAGTLHDKLAARGADLLLTVLDEIAAGRAYAQPQSPNGVTYAHKIDKAETQLRWERPAVELERAVRAFRPAPGAMARFAEQPIKIWRARIVDGFGEPGVVLAQGDVLTVACGKAALAIDELQPAGGRRMSAGEFVRGHRLPAGARLQ
jgi:methionyl-tRNA formyltransferase